MLRLEEEIEYDKYFNKLPPSLSGHAWTVAPSLFKPRVSLPPGTHWEYWFDDPDVGRVGIHGVYHDVPGAKALAIVVHGLGGSPDSNYVVTAAGDLIKENISVLRLGLRGSEGIGDDLYFAGCSGDLKAAISHPLFDSFDTIYLVGYSLGGHIILYTGTENLDPRVKGLISVCAPIDLAAGSVFIESPAKWFYRHYMLIEMKRMYARLSKERRPNESVFVPSIGSIKKFDEKITCRRWGYENVDVYYREVSVAHRLENLTVPAVYLYTANDPMVIADTIEPHLQRPYQLLKAFKIENGGHVYLQKEIDLGVEGVEKRLYPQALRLLQDWHDSGEIHSRH